MRSIGFFVRQHWIIGGAGVALLCLVVWWFLRSGEEVVEDVPNIDVVTRGDIQMHVTGTGQVYAKNQVNLKPVKAGDAITIAHVAITNDQSVRKGTTIAILDTDEAEKEVRDAVIAVRAARIALRQTAKEFDKKTEDDKLSRQKQEIALQQAQNRLADAYDTLRDYTIRAPFDGTVTDLAVSAGDTVSREDVIASVISDDLIARISLNEVDAAHVQKGMTATLSFDALPGITVQGTVQKINTIGTVQQNVVSYEAEIAFARVDGLKPGMSTSVTITIAEKNAVLQVPASSLHAEDDGTTTVTLVTDTGTFAAHTVKTGISDDVVTEITEGLEEGQSFVRETTRTTGTTQQTAESSSNRKSTTGSGFFLFGGGGPR